MSIKKLWENEKVDNKRKEIESRNGVYKYIYPVVGIIMAITFVVVVIVGGL
jgi:hypothetical protein